MSVESDAALLLASILGDDHRLTPKLDEFVKRREAAEAAEKQLRETQQNSDSTKATIDAYTAQKTKEIEQAQARHDEAAAEAARRIALQNSQIAQISEKERELEVKSVALSQVEDNLRRREQELGQLQRELGVKNAEIALQKADLASKHNRLRAAMG